MKFHPLSALLVPAVAALAVVWASTEPQDARGAETRRTAQPESRAAREVVAAPLVIHRKPTLKPGPLTMDLRPADIRTFTDPRPQPTELELFERWAKETNRILSSRFEVPEPGVSIEPGRVPSLDCMSVGIYVPSHRTIRVWELTPQGNPFTFEQLRYIFLHGWLHHLHVERGQPIPPDHVREFDRWLQVLGMWRPR